ncbi:tRNA (adenosine(37)-N6)-threonylcarbamoyltransferase complex dimerization subunit type 1 TsaB [Pontiella sulfatireligans]|uniref:tRNA threonylcarbamoyladenosine biosynthesis protein TsaB n=1 Tax=Pontiella sulfatireligans TaxID=2750658 RepID=A0A6C2UK03_9BACT|nr:tRNA (adenosine(37)-N6)-threonylcarbamoyltransferase complex dimerization subunit type 1 TsaB [Pontiella sulfatireligans]VGO20289.1 tRNA threonylcarbamoyladenosine biosynthesis protein TsaB [Pontiella sulfatireligans]
MKIFAIDLSSRFGSIALVEGGAVSAESSWEETFKNRQQLFDSMAEMAVDWSSVDLFAVGRGPGAFSGMRIGFSVINSLAAPSKAPVYALNSGAALAAQCGAPQTAVVGDARRSKVWAGVFSGTELEKEFQLMELDELAGFVPPDALVVSPDHDRLQELLENFRTLGNAAPVFPTAGALGLLVSQRLERGIASEPFEPLYMHPPVFIAPRFPA